MEESKDLRAIECSAPESQAKIWLNRFDSKPQSETLAPFYGLDPKQCMGWAYG